VPEQRTGSLTLWWDDNDIPPGQIDAIVKAYGSGTPCSITDAGGATRSVRITRVACDEAAQYSYVEWVENV
jgi:hypothetical protein